MSGPVFIPKVNFASDLRTFSLALALALAGLAAVALVETTVLLWDSWALSAGEGQTLKQADALGAEVAALRSQRRDEPDPAAIKALRQRITALNALDYAGAPSVVRVLSALEGLMPPSVALETFEYDRSRGALELVAISQSSEDLTAFFDVANRNKFFASVRLVDKKQAGSTEGAAQMYEVRLSVRFGGAEPRS